MSKKNKINTDDYITKRQATLLLGFKNSRSIAKLIKQEYLKAYMIDSSKREVLKKEEVLALPQQDPPPQSIKQ
jgi:hypothetical protein